MTHTHSDFKQVQFNQYIKPRLNILQILRRLNYIEDKNILFTSISSACKAIKNFLEFMQYVSSLNISELITTGYFFNMFHRDQGWKQQPAALQEKNFYFRRTVFFVLLPDTVRAM